MIYHGKKQVTTAGVAEPLFAVGQKAAFITFWPAKTDGAANSGQVRIGGAYVNPTTGVRTFPPGSIAPGLGGPINVGDAAVTWNAQAVNPWDLSEIYIDANNAGDGVTFIWGTV